MRNWGRNASTNGSANGKAAKDADTASLPGKVGVADRETPRVGPSDRQVNAAQYAVGARLHTSNLAREKSNNAFLKVMALLPWTIIPFLIGGLIYVCMNIPATKVFAIQKDTGGNVVPLGPVTTLEPATRLERQVALKRWLEDLYVTLDKNAQKAREDRVYGMLAAGSQAESEVDNIYKDPNYDPNVLRHDRKHLEISIPGVDATDDEHYSVNYTVRRIDQDNSAEATSKIHATFDVKFEDSVDTAVLWVNPNRLFIDEFHDQPAGS